MSISRKIAALRALAERPGTEAEGRVARAKLAELEAKAAQRDPYDAFRDYLRTGSMDDLDEACRRRCDCGAYSRPFSGCPNAADHQRIADEIRQRFPKGTRVYYNYWAYEANCPAVVAGYPKPGTLFSWIRLKFDHLKNVGAVPILSDAGWHLSTEPLNRERQRPLRGGMEQTEDAFRRAADSTAEAMRQFAERMMKFR